MMNLSDIISEIGEASAKPFDITKKPMIEVELNQYANHAEKFPGDDNNPWVAEESFAYEFVNDDGVEYIVEFNGYIEIASSYYTYSMRRALSGGRDIGPNKITFNNSFNVSFNRVKDRYRGEKETNMFEQYRVLATVVKCIRDFIERADKTPIPIMRLDIVPKADEGDDSTSMDSRRGRFYLAYVLKQVRSLPGDWSVIRKYDETGVEIKRGKSTGSAVIDLDA